MTLLMSNVAVYYIKLLWKLYLLNFLRWKFDWRKFGRNFYLMRFSESSWSIRISIDLDRFITLRTITFRTLPTKYKEQKMNTEKTVEEF